MPIPKETRISGFLWSQRCFMTRHEKQCREQKSISGQEGTEKKSACGAWRAASGRPGISGIMHICVKKRICAQGI